MADTFKVEVNVESGVLLDLCMMAHEADVTLNDFCIKILRDKIGPQKSEIHINEVIAAIRDGKRVSFMKDPFIEGSAHYVCTLENLEEAVGANAEWIARDRFIIEEHCVAKENTSQKGIQTNPDFFTITHDEFFGFEEHKAFGLVICALRNQEVVIYKTEQGVYRKCYLSRGGESIDILWPNKPRKFVFHPDNFEIGA